MAMMNLNAPLKPNAHLADCGNVDDALISILRLFARRGAELRAARERAGNMSAARATNSNGEKSEGAMMQ